MRSRKAPSPSRAGFTLIELLVVVAIIAVLVGILLPSLAGARKAARTSICMSNMRQHAMGMLNYSTDSKGWLSTFSWEPGKAYSEWSDLNYAPSAPVAHAYQAVDAIRRFLARDAAMQPAVTDRLLSRNYSYLVLVAGGYFGSRLPEQGVVCPEDRDPLVWQSNFAANPTTTSPAVILQGTPDPDPAASAAFKRTLPFWSTYQTVPCAWSIQTGGNALHQANAGVPGYHLLYTYSPLYTRFNNTRLDQVMFPSGKVYLFDLWDRHKYSRRIFHAYPVAAQPLVFFDGSVTIRKTGDANPGWHPVTPDSPAPTRYLYTPGPGEPPTFTGASSEIVTGYYRWTRRGLRGVDYAGGEVR
ncbi:MAG: prepilin-type N-terminal cleavage/methylation domain-containing protein [Phycisphaeraceae bacterium]|nr:prepilin-type N-terminal cleavage/methylation domain-containing protein [Phycisphaeraceae bacterium]